MKTLLNKVSKTIALITVFSVSMAGFASAKSANQNPNINTLTVSSQTPKDAMNFSSSTSINAGDYLSFDVHYYNWHTGASNLKVVAPDLRGDTFDKGSRTFSGSVSASNLSKASGSVSVTFNDKVKLELHDVSWQKWPCRSTSCESTPLNSDSNVFSSGLSVGDVPKENNSYYAGNVVVIYKALAADKKVDKKVDKKYDKCKLNGVTVNHGDDYRFYSERKVGAGKSCSSYDQVRTCNDGSFSGSSSYRYASCTVDKNDEATVDTKNASNITKTCATLNADIDMNGSDDVDVWFEYGKKSGNLNIIARALGLKAEEIQNIKTISDSIASGDLSLMNQQEMGAKNQDIRQAQLEEARRSISNHTTDGYVYQPEQNENSKVLQQTTPDGGYMYQPDMSEENRADLQIQENQQDGYVYIPKQQEDGPVLMPEQGEKIGKSSNLFNAETQKGSPYIPVEDQISHEPFSHTKDQWYSPHRLSDRVVNEMYKGASNLDEMDLSKIPKSIMGDAIVDRSSPDIKVVRFIDLNNGGVVTNIIQNPETGKNTLIKTFPDGTYTIDTSRIGDKYGFVIMFEKALYNNFKK